MDADLRDAAEAEYDGWNPVHVRTEQRRIWDGKRYKVSTVQVHDLGRAAPVEPSDKPRVKMSKKLPSYGEPPTTIERILDYIESEGPSTVADLCRGLDLTNGVAYYTLRHSESLYRDSKGVWHIKEKCRDKTKKRKGRYAADDIHDYLKRYKVGIVEDIAEHTGHSIYTVRAALKAKEGVLFEAHSKIKNEKGFWCTLWGICANEDAAV